MPSALLIVLRTTESAPKNPSMKRPNAPIQPITGTMDVVGVDDVTAPPTVLMCQAGSGRIHKGGRSCRRLPRLGST